MAVVLALVGRGAPAWAQGAELVQRDFAAVQRLGVTYSKAKELADLWPVPELNLGNGDGLRPAIVRLGRWSEAFKVKAEGPFLALLCERSKQAQPELVEVVEGEGLTPAALQLLLECALWASYKVQ